MSESIRAQLTALVRSARTEVQAARDAIATTAQPIPAPAHLLSTAPPSGRAGQSGHTTFTLTTPERA
jgi:hypothetical protein